MSSMNANTVNAYFHALSAHDEDAVMTLLSDDVREIIPLAPSGAPLPWAVFNGRNAVQEYLKSMFQNFSRIEVVDRTLSTTDDGRTLFVEANGDLTHAASGSAYKNVYVFKFSFTADGRISEILEYANPIPIAELLGIPIGASAHGVGGADEAKS